TWEPYLTGWNYYDIKLIIKNMIAVHGHDI
ncbi:unnamed protein product, partial [marine sediment metagenome]